MRKMEVFGEALATLGQEIATTAVAQDVEAAESWEKLKTMIKLAQALGLESEAFDALYSPGEKIVHKKAIWYRRQKRVLKAALALGVDVTGMTLEQAMEATNAARDATKTPAQRESDALQMLTRTVKGAMKATKDKRKVVAELVTVTGKRANDTKH